MKNKKNEVRIKGFDNVYTLSFNKKLYLNEEINWYALSE